MPPKGTISCERCCVIMNANGAVRVVTDQVGTPTAARGACRDALDRSSRKPEIRGIHHWTDAGVASWYDFAVAIAEEGAQLGLVAQDVVVTPIATAEYPTPARRPPYSVLDKTSLTSLGFTPIHWRKRLRERSRRDEAWLGCWLLEVPASSARTSFITGYASMPLTRVVVLDALTYAGNLANLEPVMSRPEIRFVRGDICDSEHLERLLREEADRHDRALCRGVARRSLDTRARCVRPDQHRRHPHACSRPRAKSGSRKKRSREHRFHHVSTDEVYGSLGPQDPAFHEHTPYAPNSPYSASKAGSDHLVRAYHHTYGLQTTISNCSNNYGPYHFPEKLIPLMIVNILQGVPLPVYGDGKNVRDWLYVEDHCRGIELILAEGKPGHTYNIGGRSECENVRLVSMLCEAAQELFAANEELKARFPLCPIARGEPAASLIQFVADRPGHDRRYAIDCDKIERELAFRPTVSLDAGLRETLRWYVAHESWWRAVMNGSYREWVELHYKGAHPSPFQA